MSEPSLVPPPAADPPTEAGRVVWYRSLYWRIALGFVATVAIVLVLQAALFLWLASTNDTIACCAVSATSTSAGASGDVFIIFEDEPMCRHTTVPVSAHVAKKGSQYPLWMLGSPR